MGPRGYDAAARPASALPPARPLAYRPRVPLPPEPSLEVKTPDGVVLRQPLAGAGARLCAALLDLILLLLPLAVLLLALLVVASADPTGLSGFVLGLLLGGSLLLAIGYRVGFELAWSGQTPGKRACGIRVVGADGRPVGATGVLLRGLFWPLEAAPIPVPIGLVAIFATPRQRRLGDLVAGTLVVREPPPRPLEPWPDERWSTLPARALPLEPGLAARLGPRDLDLLRRLIVRQGLDLERRRELFVRTARHYARRLGLGEFEDARVVLKELYLFAREQLAPRA
jgi:uncharacterized RDD family membrane protein YckC